MVFFVTTGLVESPEKKTLNIPGVAISRTVNTYGAVIMKMQSASPILASITTFPLELLSAYPEIVSLFINGLIMSWKMAGVAV